MARISTKEHTYLQTTNTCDAFVSPADHRPSDDFAPPPETVQGSTGTPVTALSETPGQIGYRITYQGLIQLQCDDMVHAFALASPRSLGFSNQRSTQYTAVLKLYYVLAPDRVSSSSPAYFAKETCNEKLTGMHVACIVSDRPSPRRCGCH